MSFTNNHLQYLLNWTVIEGGIVLIFIPQLTLTVDVMYIEESILI